MAHALIEHGVDMIIRERVEDVSAVTAKFDQVGALKRAQLMGDGRLGRLCGIGNIGYAQLAAHEGIENLDARSVAKDLEEVCKVVEQLLVGKVFGRASCCKGSAISVGVAYELRGLFVHGNILSYEHALIFSSTDYMNACSYVNGIPLSTSLFG